MSERPRVTHEVEGTAWTLLDAWRGASGLGLGYFVADDGGADRRVALEADVMVPDLDEDAFRSLWSAGAPLTASERRFEAADGALWLAQAVGPVWHEGGTAREVIGVRLRCLTADRPIVSLRGTDLSELGNAELAAAVASPEP